MKVVRIKRLNTLKFDQRINSTIDKEEDAIEWAKSRGADTLYRFEPGKLWIIRADIKKKKDETI